MNGNVVQLGIEVFLIAIGLVDIFLIVYTENLRKIARKETTGLLFCKVQTKNKTFYGWAYKHAIIAIRNSKDTQSSFFEFENRKQEKLLIAYQDIVNIRTLSSNFVIMLHN